jgi:RNA polymerase sigma-70 factor (ECF subfamily)
MSNAQNLHRYRYWLSVAYRHARVSSEADDLLQDALLIALQRSILPLQTTDSDAWFAAVIRKQASMQARGAVRARQREQRHAEPHDGIDTSGIYDAGGHINVAQLLAIAAAQRSVLLLALHGLDRAEICQVLDISDDALRQRLAALKRSVAGTNLSSLGERLKIWLAARGAADVGLRRAALARGPARLAGFRMGVTDPDGHLLGIHAPRKVKT